VATRIETIEHHVCDMHTREDIEATVQREWDLNGKHHVIDLCAKDAERFDKAMAPFNEHAQTTRAKRGRARRVRNRSNVSTSAGTSENASNGMARPTNAEIRAWAKTKGIEVNEQGRIKQAVVDRYNAERAKQQ
jgi:hypothetical protein